jgi:hypothetical protein
MRAGRPKPQKKQGERKMKKLLLLYIVLLVISCTYGPMSSTGSLYIAVESTTAKTIEPTKPMVCASYEVSGAGPMGATFGPLVVAGDTQVDDLLPGTWTVTVVGRNVDTDPIGEGSNSGLVIVGQTSSLGVTV